MDSYKKRMSSRRFSSESLLDMEEPEQGVVPFDAPFPASSLKNSSSARYKLSNQKVNELCREACLSSKTMKVHRDNISKILKAYTKQPKSECRQN